MKTLRLVTAEYLPALDAMRAFTAARDASTPDELWLAEHAPVFTLGQAGRPEHVLAPGDIPVVQTDRGGQVTYHGPGQVVAYPLLDLKRQGIYVKEHVHRLEQAVLCTLADVGVTGQRVAGAPGIFVALHGGGEIVGPRQDRFAGLAKIAALGVKISRSCSYHGVALNVAMDLEPFSRINPCGFAGLQTADLTTLGVHLSWEEAAARLTHHLTRFFPLRPSPP
jgi:lipoyl(octanoyl) transferase